VPERRSSASPVEGFVAPGYEPVRDAFSAIHPRSAPGGAFAAVADGRPVVDIWGGRADERGGRAWDEQTIVPIFSGTKGVVATALLVLVERGLLEPAAPVASVWPAFAARGKAAITIAEALAHLAGVPGIEAPISLEDARDPVAMAALVAAQRRLLPPGAVSYHAMTWGWIADALARRSDGRGAAALVADELAEPLGLQISIGLPPELEPRVAHVFTAGDFLPAARLGGSENPLLGLVYDNPPLLGTAGESVWNDPAMHRAEIPSGGGIAAPRSLARLYGCLAGGGEIDGVRVLEPATIQLGRSELARGPDALSGRPLAFGLGYELPAAATVMGPEADAFGHSGAGGSANGAWPRLATGFSYGVAEMRPESSDVRAATLLAALHASRTAELAA
jgi:CubicO group peptidase (beta-lactamase class C family)